MITKKNIYILKLVAKWRQISLTKPIKDEQQQIWYVMHICTAFKGLGCTKKKNFKLFSLFFI